MNLLDRLVSAGSKRVLVLDCGGIQGAITLGFLARIEAILRERYGQPDLVRANYFDLIGGTSLALGMTVDNLRTLYLKA